MMRVLNVPAGRFLVVGCLGFLVDAGVMELVIGLTGLSPLWARSISFPIALSLTWALNRSWTFPEGRARGVKSQYAIYLAVQLTGLAINYGIFAALLGYHPYWEEHPVLALAIGAGAAMVFTFVLSKAVAFAAPRTDRSSGNPADDPR